MTSFQTTNQAEVEDWITTIHCGELQDLNTSTLRTIFDRAGMQALWLSG